MQENILEKFRQGIMGVSKKKIVVKSEEDSDGEEKGRLCFVIRPTEGLAYYCLNSLIKSS